MKTFREFCKEKIGGTEWWGNPGDSTIKVQMSVMEAQADYMDYIAESVKPKEYEYDCACNACGELFSVVPSTQHEHEKTVQDGIERHGCPKCGCTEYNKLEAT